MSRIENACPFGYAADQCCGCDRCQSPGWQWVRISDVMVEMLRGEGCGPVHIRVEPRPGNEVELIATRVTPHAEAIRVLEAERDAIADQCAEAERTLNQAWQERDRLRAALVGVIGADGREALEAMAAVIRAAVAPADDTAVSIDAIHALLDTLPQEDRDDIA